MHSTRLLLARSSAVAVILAACAGLAHADGMDAEGIKADYRCADGSAFTATFTPPGEVEGSVTLTYEDGHMLTLPQVISADGGRYEKDGTQFWIKGNGGTLTIDGKDTSCEASS